VIIIFIKIYQHWEKLQKENKGVPILWNMHGVLLFI